MGFDNRLPIRTEQAAVALPVTGRLPPGLHGTLFRNGPNPCVPAPGGHWFFGDGMLHAFAVGPNGVTYANRWVRTRSWARAAGEPADALPDGLANTHVLPHGGRLLALEEGHLPVAIDPATLSTIGTVDFADALPAGPFTAHPKRDPRTGALVFFGYGVHGPFNPVLRTGEVGRDGTLRHLRHIDAPYAAMVHDFAVTPRLMAVPLFPLVFDAAAGPIVWRPERGAFLGVIDRVAGAAAPRWVPAPAGFAFHMMNAWEEGDTLCIDLVLYDAPPFFPDASGATPDHLPSRLCRWTLDLADPAAQVRSQVLSAVEGEFPRIDERVEGLRYRHGFLSVHHGLCHRDALTGAERFYTLPEGDSVSEPVFVPRGAEEGDGWLLAVVFRAATCRSDLVILDATDIAAGPVATAHLASRVPAGFHGAWLGAEP